MPQAPALQVHTEVPVYQSRAQSDLLAAVNHNGEQLDFHSLRHTCGAWLAIAGARPEAVRASGP